MTPEALAPRKCIGVDCTNDAGSLQCPSCLKIGKESFFCSQDCFKRSWVGLARPAPQSCEFQLTRPRVSTKLFTNHKVTPSDTFSPQVLSLNPIQQPVDSIPSPPLPLLAPSDPSILSRPRERYRLP